MRLILDASPVICLAKAGLLEKVLTLATEVKVPRAVQAEICARVLRRIPRFCG